MCNSYKKVLRTRLLWKYDKFCRCVVYFFITHCVGEHSRHIDNGGIVVEKHARLYSVGRSVKSEVYKSNCKSIYQLNLQKNPFVLCKWIWGNELSLPSFINDGNDAATKRSFAPNFQAWVWSALDRVWSSQTTPIYCVERNKFRFRGYKFRVQALLFYLWWVWR